jgi:hypothetical protein
MSKPLWPDAAIIKYPVSGTKKYRPEGPSLAASGLMVNLRPEITRSVVAMAETIPA